MTRRHDRASLRDDGADLFGLDQSTTEPAPLKQVGWARLLSPFAVTCLTCQPTRLPGTAAIFHTQAAAREFCRRCRRRLDDV